MTITLNLPPDIEAGLLAQAQAEGLALSEYVQILVRDQVEAQIIAANAPRLPSEEWMISFRAWAESPSHLNLPVLSDEAISRESNYEERGL